MILVVWRTCVPSIQTLDSNRFCLFPSFSPTADILLYNQSLASLTSKLVFLSFEQTLTFPLFSSSHPLTPYFSLSYKPPPLLTFYSLLSPCSFSCFPSPFPSFPLSCFPLSLHLPVARSPIPPSTAPPNSTLNDFPLILPPFPIPSPVLHYPLFLFQSPLHPFPLPSFHHLIKPSWKDWKELLENKIYFSLPLFGEQTNELI